MTAVCVFSNFVFCMFSYKGTCTCDQIRVCPDACTSMYSMLQVGLSDIRASMYWVSSYCFSFYLVHYTVALMILDPI